MITLVQPAPTLELTYSPEAYLALDRQSDQRHEYCQGVVQAMTGGTPNHNRITVNLCTLLRFALKRQPYDVFVTDQRLWIPEADRYTYPDLMVTRDPLELQAGRRDTVMNPLLIAEVLSRSTGQYDKGEKFAAYRTIGTVQEYLTIDQYQLQVEHYLRVDRGWLFRDYTGLDAEFTLESIGLAVALADLYDKVDFDQGNLDQGDVDQENIAPIDVTPEPEAGPQTQA